MKRFAIGDKVIVPSRPSLGVCTVEKVLYVGFSGEVYAISTKVGLQKESAANLESA